MFSLLLPPFHSLSSIQVRSYKELRRVNHGSVPFGIGGGTSQDSTTVPVNSEKILNVNMVTLFIGQVLSGGGRGA